MNNGSFLGVVYIINLLAFLFIFSLSIYFIITTIKFMKEKSKNDKEILLKMNELIQVIREKDLTPKG